MAEGNSDLDSVLNLEEQYASEGVKDGTRQGEIEGETQGIIDGIRDCYNFGEKVSTVLNNALMKIDHIPKGIKIACLFTS